MANAGAIVLSIVLIVLVFGAVIAIALIVAGHTADKGATGPPPVLSCAEFVDPGSLLEIPTTAEPCIQNGQVTSMFYIGDLGSQNYDYVVAPWGTQPLNVCIGFCTGYTGGVCSGPNYNGQSAQQNFNNCMSQLTPSDCTPPLPIAIQGNILYYAALPTCKCDTCA